MATKYTLYFSDTSKTPFDLQSYTTNGPVSPSDDTLIAGATTASTTLKLWGKGLKEYGEPVFQDLIYMLENFANSTSPEFPIEGQIWYDTNRVVGGSPVLLPQLKVHDGGITWDAIIMANGASAMTGELLLSANPTSDLGAAPKQYVDDTTALAVHTHITTDVTDITATFTEINSLVGIGSPVQTQFDNIQIQFTDVQIQFTNVQTDLDNKVSRIASTVMADNVDITLGLNGEVLGLPASPSATGAASKEYVDDQLAAGAGGDGALSDIVWNNNTGGVGSPPIVITDTTLELTVTHPINPPTIFILEGISRTGHTHAAIDTSIDNGFNILYGFSVQSALEKAEDEIELLKTGGIPPSATIAVQRSFEILASTLSGAGSPRDIFLTQSHAVDDNRVVITINGVKQYAHAHSFQALNYNAIITETTATGLNPTQSYNFGIDIDGAGPITITINDGSPPSTDISTHGALVTAINNQLSGIDAVFSITNSTTQAFTTTSSGTGSSISITDPGGSPVLYLFLGGSPFTTIDGLLEVATPVAGIEGDYIETDFFGNPAPINGFSSNVVFNYDIITGSKIESLLYV